MLLYQGPPVVAKQARDVRATDGQRRDVRYEWNLAPLGIQPGSQIIFFATASDYQPCRGACEPGWSRSEPRRLSIITREELADRWGVGAVTDPDRAVVVESWHEGQARGVRGSPHFFCADRESFCPSLQIVNDPDRGLQIQRDAQRLSDFLDGCLA